MSNYRCRGWGEILLIEDWMIEDQMIGLVGNSASILCDYHGA